MKTFKLSFFFLIAGLIAVLLLMSSCSDDSVGPDLNGATGQPPAPPVEPPGEPIDPPQSDDFQFDTDDATETDEGFRFGGTLIGESGEGESFTIGEGEFSVVVDDNGVIISITGVGIPEFPDIGIYKEILKDFAWDKIESHILYEKGSYFLNEYDTEVPLNPDRFYITYRVFDESRDGNFALRGQANDIIHGFNEIYIDLDDPAVFLKFQLWNPKGGSSASVAEKFWKRAFERAKALGQAVSDYQGAPNMIVGLSNNGTFNTPEYALGLEDSQAFEDLFGFTHLESLPANMFLGLKGVPIPKTGVLQLNGHVYVHNPLISSIDGEGNKDSVLEWFNEFTNTPASASFAGSMDFGRKGIELILTGILPGVNDVVGRDIFNDDFDIDLIHGFMQEYNPNDGSEDGYFRLGGTIQMPLIADIFGPDYQKFLISKPDVNGYMYLDVGYNLENSSLFLEQAQHMILPYYGEIELTNSHFRINRDGFNFFAQSDIEIGPLSLNREIEGEFTKDGYSLSTILERDITLPNNVNLGNRGLNVSLSSDLGATLEGNINLPFDIGESSVSGQVTDQGLTMSGILSAGSELKLATGLNLPTRELELTVSTDPARMLELKGETQMPHFGYHRMTGIVNSDHFFFDGEIDRTLTFGSLDVPIGNGQLKIDSQTGLFLDANIQLPHLGSADMEGEITNQHILFKGAVNRNLAFSGVSLEMADGDILLNSAGAKLSGTLNLPANLRTAEVSGMINQNQMNLSGTMANSIPFAGRNLAVSSSSISARTGSGVTADFNLGIISGLTVNMSGTISTNGFSFSGSRSVDRSINWDLPWPLGTVTANLRISTNTTFTNNGMNMTATGRVTYQGVEYWSGTLDLSPNWSSGTIQVCIPGTNICRGI